MKSVLSCREHKLCLTEKTEKTRADRKGSFALVNALRISENTNKTEDKILQNKEKLFITKVRLTRHKKKSISIH